MTLTRAAADARLQPAPRMRQTAAGLIDLAVQSGLLAACLRWRRRDGERRRGGFAELAQARPARLLGWAWVVLAEQSPSPGARLMGLRTVDARTGRRPALWRTMALTGGKAATEAVRKRMDGVPPPLPEADRERNRRELQEIWESYRDDPEARRSALIGHYQETRIEGSTRLRQVLGLLAAQAVIDRLLQRRLDPTMVVSTRQRAASPHSP